MTYQTTLDKLLQGRLTIEQPAKGYRIAVDTLLLASAVPAQESHHILDLGCGAGGVMLALATRLRGTYITGLEIQTKLVTFCKSNIQRNAFDESLSVIESDATQLDESLKNKFDHVVMNPPFHDAARHDASPNASKRRACTQETGELEQWIASAHQALREGGMMSMINRADRQKEIITKTSALFGTICIKPILGKEGGTCKRIIIRATKGSDKKIIEKTPFILHEEDGSYTQEGDTILRDAEAMIF